MSTELTGQKEQAAALVATDTQGDREIARAVGVDVRTLTRWKKQDAFAARVTELRQALAERVADDELMEKEGRLRGLAGMARRIERVVEARATDRILKEPGADTGIIKQTVIPSGRGYSYEVDNATIKSYLDVLKQIAQERGQWTEKKETSVSGEVTVRRYVGVDVDDV